jgi:UDP-N-acetylglucosamine:LPS N-acetylglucosamine transferase
MPASTVGRPGAPNGARQRVLLVTSPGGHLVQLKALEGWWQEHQRVWVTFDAADVRSALAGERIVAAHHPTTRNLLNLVRNTVLAFRLLRRDRPDLVVSAGAGVAVPFFWLAWLLGIRTVYLEVFDRIDSPTLTGRLCYPVATHFLVQWEEQRQFYPEGINVGTLL